MTEKQKRKQGRPRKDGLAIGGETANERDSKLAVKGKRYDEALSRSSYRMFAPVEVGGGEITSSYVHITRAEYERRSRIAQGSSVGEEGGEAVQEFMPYPKQMLFLSSNHDEILFGGARGGGKSQALAQDAALHVRKWHWDGHELVVDKQSIDYPEYVALILRRKYTDIYMNFKPMCDRIYESLGAIWGEKAQCYTFPSGAKIYLKHCDEAKDVDKYIGGNYHYLGVEEANQFPERWIREIGGSVRSTNPDLKPFKRYTTNPGGVGHIWLKRRFIDVCPPKEGKLCWNEVHDLEYTELNPGEPYRDEQGNFRWFIPSLVFDNPALINGDLQYVRFLKSLDPLKKKMWLHGKWDEMSGLFFHMWSKEYHVVDEREVVVDPENCRIYRCVDYGTTNPFACLFAQVERSGRVTVFDEIYETGLTPSMQAEMILARTRQWRLTEDDIDLTVVDPAMKTGNQDMGIRLGSVLEIYQDCGVQHIALGNNARVQGWGVMKDYLRIPDMGEDGVQSEPMLRFSSRCTNAIETIPILTSDINNVEDVDTDGEDHIADSLRYLLMFIHTPFPAKIANTVPKWLQELKKKSKGEGGTITDAWTA